MRAYSLIDGVARDQAAIGTHYFSAEKRALMNKMRLEWPVSYLEIEKQRARWKGRGLTRPRAGGLM